MWALLSFVVLAPLTIGLWLLIWICEGIDLAVWAVRETRDTRGTPTPERVLNPREAAAVTQLCGFVAEYNARRIADAAKRRDAHTFTRETRATRKHARAVTSFREMCVGFGFDVSTVPALMTIEEAERERAR